MLFSKGTEKEKTAYLLQQGISGFINVSYSVRRQVKRMT